MSVQYNIYANDGLGGPVDYSTVIATVSGLSYDVGPMAQPSDTTFAVRAFDTVSTLEESNVDARVEILVDPAGVDLASLPNAPSGIRVLPGPGGTAMVSWAYSPLNQGGPPTGFHVYIGSPTVGYGSPIATVPYASAIQFYSASLTSLTGGTSYQVGARSYNAAGDETNTNTVTFTASTSGPSPVTNLSATIIS